MDTEKLRSVIDTAEQHILALKKYLVMSDKLFKALPPEEKTRKWWKVLEIDQPEKFEAKNLIKSLEKLRELFGLSPYLDQNRSGWLKRLIVDAQVVCKVCYKENKTYGLLSCRKDSVEDHLNNSTYHSQCAQNQEESGQKRIDDMHGGAGPNGMTLDDRVLMEDSKKFEALLVGSLIAGGRGAAGIPPSSIHELLNKDALNVLQYDLKAGIPSTRHIIDHTLPDAIMIVENRLTNLLKDTPISLYIDGGTASNLAMGRKVVVICASSMKWKENLLLDVLVIETHETGIIQKDQIINVVNKYKISPKNVHYICADNASPNKVTVDLLNQISGYNIKYARCLAHCLNLVVKSITSVMDFKFKFSTHLKLARQFLTAGGGLGRKLLAVEFGFTTSGIDFVDTRWASLVTAIQYVANLPSTYSTEKARERLTLLADNGDETAQAALDDNAPPREIFFVLFDLFQSVSEDQLRKEKKLRLDTNDDVTTADLSLSMARQELLKYFAQPVNFLAFQSMEILFGGNVDGDESLKTIFTITQGNPHFAAKLTSKKTGVVPNCVSATRTLLTNLRSLHYKWAKPTKVVENFATAIAREQSGVTLTMEQVSELTDKKNVMSARDRFRAKLDEKMKRFCDITIEYYRHLNCDIRDETKPFNEEIVNPWRESQMKIYNDTTAAIVTTTVYEGIQAIEEAEGLQKTLECLQGLEESQVFDVNKQPKNDSIDGKLLKHIGGTTHSQATVLMSEWRTYVSEWKQPEKLKPADVYKYWFNKRDEWKVLAPHAMRMFSRPISAAACERVFSLMEGMNKKDRNRMESATLKKVLFLRGNSEMVRSELGDANALRLQAEIDDAAQKKAKAVADAINRENEVIVVDKSEDEEKKDLVVASTTSSKKKRPRRTQSPPPRPRTPSDDDDF